MNSAQRHRWWPTALTYPKENRTAQLATLGRQSKFHHSGNVCTSKYTESSIEHRQNSQKKKFKFRIETGNVSKNYIYIKKSLLHNSSESLRFVRGIFISSKIDNSIDAQTSTDNSRKNEMFYFMFA